MSAWLEADLAIQRLKVGLFFVVVVGSLIAVGCGEDTVTPSENRGLGLDIRNGTWALAESTIFLGNDSCVALPYELTSHTDTLCNFDPAEVPFQFRFECDADTAGGNVDFDCQIIDDLGICLLVTDIAGTGVIADTTWDLEMKVFTSVKVGRGVPQSECDRLYGEFASACTTMIFSTGTWISSDGDSVCPDSNSLQKVPLETLVKSGYASGLWRQ